MSAIRRRDTHRPMRQSGGGQRVIDCAKDRIAGRAVREARTWSRAMRSRGKASLARLRLVRKRRKVRRKWGSAGDRTCDVSTALQNTTSWV